MYAIALIRYRKPLEDVLRHADAHRAYLLDLKARGVLLASGPQDPRNGGALLLRIPDDGDRLGALDAVRDNDPYVKGGVAQYELIPWAVNIGKDDLDRL